MGLVRRIIGMATRSARRPVGTRPVARRPVARRPVARRPVARRPVGRRSAVGGVIGAVRGFLRGTGRARV